MDGEAVVIGDCDTNTAFTKVKAGNCHTQAIVTNLDMYK